MIFKNLFFTSLFALSALYVCANDAEIKRIEIAKESSYDFIDCYGVSDAGMLFATKEDDKQKNVDRDHQVLTYTKYDEDLNKSTVADFTFSDKKSFDEFTEGYNLYRFALSKGNYELLYLNGKDMNGKVLSGTIGKKADYNFTKAIGNYFYVAGELKGVPYVFAQNCETGETQMNNIVLANKKKYKILSLDVDENSQEAYLFIKEFQKGVGYILKFFVYKDGKQTNEFTIGHEEVNKFPSSAFASKMSDGSYIISGTYSESDKKNNSLSVGVYLKKLENGEVKFTKFINYLDIKNFTTYMSKRKQEKVEKKKSKKEAKNEEYTINYSMLPYRIVEQNGQYLLVGEAYYATYRIEWHTIWISGANGTQIPQQQAVSVFDGYVFSHYFIVAFNDKGETEWTNAAPMDMPKFWNICRHLGVTKDAKMLHLAYPKFASMSHTAYDASGNEALKEDIEYVEKGRKIKSTDYIAADYWYDNNFLSYGYMKVKDEDGRHRSYFINKISYGSKPKSAGKNADSAKSSQAKASTKNTASKKGKK